MQQSAVLFAFGFDDLLQGLSAIFLLQLPGVFRWQLLLTLLEQLVFGVGDGPQIIGRATSSNAYTKMQIDNMYALDVNSSVYLSVQNSKKIIDNNESFYEWIKMHLKAAMANPVQPMRTSQRAAKNSICKY